MALDPDRRGDLLAGKLSALVGGAGVPTTFPGGVARVDAGRARGWVLPDRDPARALGPALVWAERHGVADLHVLVDDADVAGGLARRAGEFEAPPAIEWIDGRALRPATPTPPPDLDAPPPPAATEFVRTLKVAGTDPVVERGVVTGEINGLEVARVVVDDDGSHAYLEVGVGKHDRHAQSLVHGDRPTAEALAVAVEFVGRHRRLGAEPHPLNRLARERWLRTLVVARPELVDARALRPVSSPVARDDLRVPAPAPAVGTAADGTPLVVVCSTGIDLDLVPAAADTRVASEPPQARLVLVVPPRDDHPITRRLAGALKRPAEIRMVALEPAST